MAKKEAKETTKKSFKSKNSNLVWIVVGAIVLVLLVIILSIFGSDENGQPAEPPPVEEVPVSSVEVLGEYEGKVVYKRVPGVATEEYQSDCAERGGTFNSCGNGCSPDAEICTASCYYICNLQ